jgi:hypothetical protein
MKLAVLVALALAGPAAYADTSSIRQVQLEFLDVSASGGATARRPAVPETDRQAYFRSLDIDGDGAVSKAEAAGHAKVTRAFDRADRNRDGKLSLAEYDRHEKAAEKKAARQAAARAKDDSASAGGTRAKPKAKAKPKDG